MEKVMEGLEYSEGLTERDNEVFNKTIAELGYQVSNIEKGVNRNASIKRALGEVWDKGIFRELEEGLIKEPYRMNELHKYIHNYVPKLEEVIRSYEVVSNRRVETLELRDVLKEAEDTIKYLGEKIGESYVKYKREDVEDLNKTIDLVEEHILKRKGGN